MRLGTWGLMCSHVLIKGVDCYQKLVTLYIYQQLKFKYNDRKRNDCCMGKAAKEN